MCVTVFSDCASNNFIISNSWIQWSCSLQYRWYHTTCTVGSWCNILQVRMYPLIYVLCFIMHSLPIWDLLPIKKKTFLWTFYDYGRKGQIFLSPVKNHSLYSCFRWSLQGLFTTSTCSCEVIPPGMITRFVFMELQVIVAFISGVRCPLNTYKTSIPCFLRIAPGLLFHTTNNQSFLSWSANL